jgi:hypothetical protein
MDLANKAQEFYHKLGRPSQHKFEEILKLNLIMNCPVTIDDAKGELLIYGPDLATIKGKTTRVSPAAHPPSFLAVSIPAPILEHHKGVTLCVDFCCSGLSFPAHHIKKESTPNCKPCQ